MASKGLHIGTRKSAGKTKGKTTSAPESLKVRSEDDYMAEEDARTCARANAIKADPERRARAAKAAVKLAEEKRSELRGLNGLARGAR